MPVFTVQEMVDMVQDLWRQDTDSTLDEDIVYRYFRQSVRLVETFDFPRDNEYVVTLDTITFSTVPSNVSQGLYALKTLTLISNAILNGDVQDSDIGVSWRSGMESVSTSTAGQIKKSINDGFHETYKSALAKAKISGHTPTRFDIYDDL